MLAHLLFGVSSVFLRQGTPFFSMVRNLVTELWMGVLESGIPLSSLDGFCPLWGPNFCQLYGLAWLLLLWAHTNLGSWRAKTSPPGAPERELAEPTASRGHCGVANLGASWDNHRKPWKGSQINSHFLPDHHDSFQKYICLCSFGRYKIEMRRTRTCWAGSRSQPLPPSPRERGRRWSGR